MPSGVTVNLLSTGLKDFVNVIDGAVVMIEEACVTFVAGPVKGG
jgi:hypothetical protein